MLPVLNINSAPGIGPASHLPSILVLEKINIFNLRTFVLGNESTKLPTVLLCSVHIAKTLYNYCMMVLDSTTVLICLMVLDPTTALIC